MSFLGFWFKSEHEVNDPLIDYVTSIKSNGVVVVVATNQEKYRTEYMLREMGFDGLFDAIYSSAHIGQKKPSLGFYEHILLDQEVLARDAIFWEDDQENIDGAVKCGIESYLYIGLDDFETKMTQFLST